MPGLNEISPTQLMRLIGTPQCPALIDVCIDEDFNDDPHLLPSARRFGHNQIDAIAAQVADTNAVIICQKGRKLSHGVAARLRHRGISAEVLAGGHHGWREAALPRIPAQAIPGHLWVTRHRPKIDRIACPWLIRRFVDPAAEFLFVPPGDVLDVADRFGATPFDVEGVKFSHQDANCSFDAMIKLFCLSHPALDALADIVRAADTNRHDLAPQAAGLLAISVGLSRMFRDDSAQMDAAMLVYDALYRWARDGQDEGHDWPMEQPR